MQDLAQGWDSHVAFGLTHPDLFILLSGDPAGSPTAAAAGMQVLRARVHAIADAGRVKVSEPRATALLHAVCTGTVLALLADPPESRDEGLSTAARDAVLAAITGDAPQPANPAARQAAITLYATLDQTPALSQGERALLKELLTRIAYAG